MFDWSGTHHLACSCVGLSHLRHAPPLPNQDFTVTSIAPRPMAMVLDGMGSSKLSHIGSRECASALRIFVHSIEPILRKLLDDEEDETKASELAKTVKWMVGTCFTETMKQLAANYGHDELATRYNLLAERLGEKKIEAIKHFRSVISLVVVGVKRIFWFKIGDAPIIGIDGTRFMMLGKDDKGIFSNQTKAPPEHFDPNEYQHGLVGTNILKDIVIVSDGAGSHFIGHNGSGFHAQLGEWLEQLRRSEGAVKFGEIFEYLARAEIWRGMSKSDDRSIAMLCLPLSVGSPNAEVAGGQKPVEATGLVQAPVQSVQADQGRDPAVTSDPTEAQAPGKSSRRKRRKRR